MTGILLDTNIVIDFLCKKEDAFRYIGALPSKPTISVVTVTELVAGARSRREEERIGRLDELVHIRPVTLEIARRAGEYCRHYQSAHGFDDLDAIIAATADHHELPLATLNVKHFPMFRRLKPAY